MQAFLYVVSALFSNASENKTDKTVKIYSDESSYSFGIFNTPSNSAHQEQLAKTSCPS